MQIREYLLKNTSVFSIMQKRGDCTAETMDNPTKITGAKGELLRSFLHRLRRGNMLKYYHTVSVVFDTGEHYDKNKIYRNVWN